MKITSIRATPVRVPLTRSAPMSQGTRKDVGNTIVEVETDAGLVGVGETRGTWAAAIIRDELAPKLIGKSAMDRAAARAACVPKFIDFGFPDQPLRLSAFAGIEIALWDLLGQQAAQPVFRLLGGPVFERAPFAAYAYTVDLSDGHSEADVPRIMADYAAKMIAETGSSMFEYKIGRHSVACETATLHAVRQAVGPRVQLSVDVNMAYTLDMAREYLAGAADACLSGIEEPVPDLADLERLRGEFDVPISTHCAHLDALIPYPHIDAVVTDLFLHGGFEGTLAIYERVRANHRQFWLRAMWELGIAWAAMCHFGMTRRDLTRPAQALIHLPVDDLILGEPWLIKKGGVRPPEQPGLGIELDRDALKKYTVS